MSTKIAKAKVPGPSDSAETQLAFLLSLQNMGNDERILQCGEYLLNMTNNKMPTRETEFRYGRWGAGGENTVPSRQNVPYAPQGTPQSLTDRVMKQVMTDEQMQRITRTSNFIEGEYTLVVNGVDLSFAMGDKVPERNPETKAIVMNVRPVNQDFPGKIKIVNPRTSAVEWLWLWMHPRTMSSPGRMSKQEQEDCGISVQMASKFYLAHHTPLIKMDANLSAKGKEIQAGAEVVALSAKIEALPVEKLKAYAKATGCVPSAMDMTMPMTDVYKFHLLSVLTDQSGLDAANRRKANLKVLLNGTDDWYGKTVETAIRAGVLVEEDREWFLRDSSGAMTQPDSLGRYFVPDGCSVAAEWLAAEMERNSDDRLRAVIDQHAKEHGKVPETREPTSDAITAIDRAISTGAIKRVQTGGNKGEWRTPSGEVVAKANGATPEQHRKDLLLYASSVTLPTLLATLGLAEFD